jgi:ceramide glucosyltransferase
MHLSSLLNILGSHSGAWKDIEFCILLVSLLLSLSAIAYYCYAIYAAAQFFSQASPIDYDFHPPVSILKPICGCDSRTYENLASFCRQDYPTYQVIFGVQSWHDSSIGVIKQIIADFPDVDIQYVISDRDVGTNRKVGNLIHAFTKADYGIVLLADSDVYVHPNYLQQVVQPLSHPKVGVVTCLYRSLTEGWVAALEALVTATEFHPGVLVSTQTEGIKFAMGQTIVLRRSVLQAIGGFEAIANYLADDYQLGYLPTQVGYKVALSHHMVDHILPVSTLLKALQRQLRWMMGIRVSRPWGYAGLIFTYGTVASLVFLLATEGSSLGWLVLGVTWAARLTMAWFIGVRHLHDPVAKQFLWFVPFRDFVSFALWCYSFIGNRIQWRGLQFRLTNHGELVEYIPSMVSDNVKSITS